MIQIALNAIAILGGIVGEQALSPYVQGILVWFMMAHYWHRSAF